MSKKRSIFQRIGSFRLTIIAAAFIFCHCFLATFEPVVAALSSLGWLLSILLGLAASVDQIVEIIKARMGKDSRDSRLLLNRFIASFLLFFVVFGFQFSIGMFGAWTRVMLYGGSGKVRASMMPLFDQFPVDEHNYHKVDKRSLSGLVNWANEGAVIVGHDRISVYPRFFMPMDGGGYVLMKDPDDQPESGPYNKVYQHFGNGLWLLVDDD